ncbi:hypothetical protein RHMOL_Rhmol08G0189500 [Rhododendron molle]|uniref:Uncharacterized protein n=1 Tax=Rhododendron molle TaxID=49168 RepID=A0ACC0MPX6_RHOML|nr:hypothetical protein RHMOL_Rhmol08G0189500 [Rhododendron molle]
MAKSVNPDAISILLANPSPDSSLDGPTDIVVQILDMKNVGNKFAFTASDWKMNLKAVLRSTLSSEVESGRIQNLGLISILNYTVHDIPMMNREFLIVTKCAALSPALEAEIKAEGKTEESGIVLKPKPEISITSARMEPHRVNYLASKISQILL